MDEEQVRALAARFFDAVAAGDLAAVEACYAPGARIWHNTDGKEQSREENLRTLRGFASATVRRRYLDRRLQVFPGGFVHQHVLEAERTDGRVLRLPACIVCAVADGRITRLDEYFDGAAVDAWRSAAPPP